MCVCRSMRVNEFSSGVGSNPNVVVKYMIVFDCSDGANVQNDLSE